jgi:peptidoglycan glycosyltransferase
MNKPIRTLAIGCMVLFALLLFNINYIQVIEASDLNDRSTPTNKRARDAECSRQRGPILVDGDSVARSVESDDALKYQRKYSQGKLYAPLTGYFSCYFGATAIENTENSILSGSDPALFVNRIVDLVGNEQPEGGSVLLTIDPDAQQAAAAGLEAVPGDASGAVVALNPHTGAILAMVSAPSYDPNVVSTHDFTAAQEALDALNHDPDLRLRNRATQELYPPGSTFKLVTAAAALSNGYSSDSLVKGGSSLDLPQSSRPLRNENGFSCGGDQVTMTYALANSCNVSFGDLGLKLGPEKLREQAAKFGFGEDVLDELLSSTSEFPASLGNDDPLTAYSAIGQYDVKASPLQMAMVAAGIANGGDVMKPYVVQEVRSPDLDVLDEAEPEVLHEAVTPDVADQLTQMMVEVVQSGTATSLKDSELSIAAKTGTANSSPDRPPYAWMVAFAPADNPQVAVAVLVEQSGTDRGEISGNGLAGPIAKAVMEAVLNR